MRFNSGSSDPFTVLGVKPGATSDEIKSAYKKLALQYHPDRNKDPGAEDRFKEISQAYTALNDPSKRAQYEHMHRAASGGGGGGGSSARSYGGGGSGGQSPFSSGDFQRSQGFGFSFDDSGSGTRGASGTPRMSRTEADTMFRNMFGNMEDLLRQMDTQQRRGGYANTSKTQQTNQRIYTTEDGAKHYERIETDLQGRTEKITRTEYTDGTVKELRQTIANRQQNEARQNLHQTQPPPNWGNFSNPFDRPPGSFKGFGDLGGSDGAGAPHGAPQGGGSPFGFGNARRRQNMNPFGTGGGETAGNPFGGTTGRRSDQNPFGQFATGGSPFTNGMGFGSLFSPHRVFARTLLMVIILSALLSFFVHHPGVALLALLIILFLRGGRM